jgi:saccharopine dehydrogenase (NAD+, L-lysine forming)
MANARRSDGDIVIVGGYGHVGREIARVLAPAFPGRVVVAGRDAERGEVLAVTLGSGVRALRADASVDIDVILAGARLVIMCLDLGDATFVARCLAAGVDYIDITADDRTLAAIEALDPVACAGGATAVISVGLAPGLTNLLVAHAAEKLAAPTRADIFVLLGLGDKHGDAAIAWTLDNLDAAFTLLEDGRTRAVRSFGERARVRLPGESRERSAYRFAFPDQRVVTRTLALSGASTYLCFDSRAMTWLLRLFVASGLARVLRVPAIRRVVSRLLRSGSVGSDGWTILARVYGHDGVSERCALRGRREAEITGLVAAEIGRRLLGHEGAPGVRHIEQFVRLAELLPALQRGHLALEVVLPEDR